jgi:hypothetical protein
VRHDARRAAAPVTEPRPASTRPSVFAAAADAPPGSLSGATPAPAPRLGGGLNFSARRELRDTQRPVQARGDIGDDGGGGGGGSGGGSGGGGGVGARALIDDFFSAGDPIPTAAAARPAPQGHRNYFSDHNGRINDDDGGGHHHSPAPLIMMSPDVRRTTASPAPARPGTNPARPSPSPSLSLLTTAGSNMAGPSPLARAVVDRVRGNNNNNNNININNQQQQQQYKQQQLQQQGRPAGGPKSSDGDASFLAMLNDSFDAQAIADRLINDARGRAGIEPRANGGGGGAAGGSSFALDRTGGTARSGTAPPPPVSASSSSILSLPSSPARQSPKSSPAKPAPEVKLPAPRPRPATSPVRPFATQASQLNQSGTGLAPGAYDEGDVRAKLSRLFGNDEATAESRYVPWQPAQADEDQVPERECCVGRGLGLIIRFFLNFFEFLCFPFSLGLK